MTPTAVAAFIASRYGMPLTDVRVSLESLAGGLESAVVRANLDTASTSVPSTIIVKEMRGRSCREAGVYRSLAGHVPPSSIGRVLGAWRHHDVEHLFMEDLGPPGPWPWADLRVVREVCRVLARLHQARVPSASVADWDYESELLASAHTTFGAAAVARDRAGVRYWKRLGDLRLLVRRLPAIRKRLAERGFVVIHGDVHPNNVVIHTLQEQRAAVLIDWARARPGSPFEDIASWLHSIGCWEPEARRRHDSLLASYLREYDQRLQLCPTVRMLYWFAGASNGLAGAVRYHLAVLQNPESTADACATSRHALRDWERVIRRAAHLIRVDN